MLLISNHRHRPLPEARKRGRFDVAADSLSLRNIAEAERVDLDRSREDAGTREGRSGLGYDWREDDFSVEIRTCMWFLLPRQNT